VEKNESNQTKQKTTNESETMKTKIIQQICLFIGLGLLFCSPSISYAGGNVPQADKGQVIARFTPIKSDQETINLQPGDVIVRVCRDCGAVTLVRVTKPGGKGVYDYVAKKCDNCGSENTYMAVTKDPIQLKESGKQ
jgi:hypothetical protein